MSAFADTPRPKKRERKKKSKALRTHQPITTLDQAISASGRTSRLGGSTLGGHGNGSNDRDTEAGDDRAGGAHGRLHGARRPAPRGLQARLGPWPVDWGGDEGCGWGWGGWSWGWDWVGWGWGWWWGVWWVGLGCGVGGVGVGLGLGWVKIQ